MTGKSGAGASRSGGDTATKVLSVPTPAKGGRDAEDAEDAEDAGNAGDAAAGSGDADDAAGATRKGGPAREGGAAGDESGDAGAGPEGQDAPDTAGEAGSGEGDRDRDGGEARPGAGGLGDARLRAAVAAWVNSADTKGSTDSDEGSTDAGADGAEETTDVRDEAEGASGAGTKSAADDASKAADERARAADPDAGDARDEGSTGTTGGSGRNATEADEISTGTSAIPAPGTAAASKTAADPQVSGELKDSDDAATLRDRAAPGDGRRTEATDRNGSATGVAAAGPEADAAPRLASDPAGQDRLPDGSRKHDRKPDEDEDQHHGRGDREEARDGEGADESTGAAGRGSGAERPVDQPTTMLKLGPAARPPVDQPTTMLKLGGAARSSGKQAPETPKEAPESPEQAPEPSERTSESSKKTPEPSKKTPEPTKQAPGSPKRTPEPSKQAPGSETAAERTSRFVALKPLDAPATRKPKSGTTGPGAPAGTAGPAVPADATRPVPQLGPERTTQQPLPPKPPLDLLAELTNTPPPPPTPLRTFVRRVKIWTPLVLLLVVVFAVVQTLRPLPAPTLDLTAEETYTFDGGKADLPWPSDGQGALDVQGIGTFGSSGDQKPAPIASVAKVMTAYLILRDHPLKDGDGEKIKVDEPAERQATNDGESTVKVHAGDTITQKEALEGVLIASANNVARLLARWDSGSEKAFVGKMNDAAKGLGMTNTTYTDPSGLEKTTVSTAVDQVKLAKAAMKDPSFRDIAKMMEYVDYKGAKHPNWNRLVGSNGVIGIKTGTTTAAGGNLVFAATKKVGDDTKTVVGAVLSQGPGGEDNTILSGALDAADKLIRAAQDALKPATILKKGDVVGYVDDGLGGRTPVAVTEDVTAVGWAGLRVKLSFASDRVPHVAKPGTRVATLTVGDGGTSGAVQVPVALTKDLVEPAWTDKLTRVG
ncbi:D-alanyl-D-alanine carboxypeptidase [Streptomyces sp. NPDC003697]